MSVQSKVEQIRRRWTDNGVLAREGFPERLLAYEHVTYLLAEIDRLKRGEGEAMSGPVCICEHKPHDGMCPELVGGRLGAPFPCGCDEYCPIREDWTVDRVSCPFGGDCPSDCSRTPQGCVYRKQGL